MAETIRSFIAVELPPEVRRQIGQLQEGLRQKGVKARWVNPDNLHLTLHFFGDIATEKIDPIREAADAAGSGSGPIRLAARSVGVFPGLRKARVIWTGVDGDLEALAILQQRLAAALEPIGFPPPRRRFRAHLTLGRFKKAPVPERLADAIEALGGFSSRPFTISQLILFKSRLTPEGAIYTRIHETPLAAGPTGPKPATLDRRTK